MINNDRIIIFGPGCCCNYKWYGTGGRAENVMIDSVWEKEKQFIVLGYRKNKRKFILNVYYWQQYFYEKPIIDQKFSCIQRDLENSERPLNEEQYMSDFCDLKITVRGGIWDTM